jgi:hypothetical protein
LFKTTRRRAEAPLFFAARGRRRLSFIPRRKSRGHGAPCGAPVEFTPCARLTLSGFGGRGVASSCDRGRAPHGAPCAALVAGANPQLSPKPGFLGRGLAGVTRRGGSPCPSPVKAPHRRVVIVPAGRSPGAAREHACEACAREPHPPERERTRPPAPFRAAPRSRRLMRAPSADRTAWI